jgi:hypothetical protein
MKEIWKPIVGYDGRYLVSSIGRIKSSEVIITERTTSGKRNNIKGILLKTSKGRLYYQIGLTKEYIRKTFYVHRIVAKAFIFNPKNKPCINHIDGDKLNNRVENLEWCTRSENTIHAYRTHLFPDFHNVGSNSGRSKLSEESALTIRETFDNMDGIKFHRIIDLSEVFGVSRSTLDRIISGYGWKI